MKVLEFNLFPFGLEISKMAKVRKLPEEREPTKTVLALEQVTKD